MQEWAREAQRFKPSSDFIKFIGERLSAVTLRALLDSLRHTVAYIRSIV